MLLYLIPIIRRTNDINSVNFQIMLEIAHLETLEKHYIGKQIEYEAQQAKGYKKCPMQPCSSCTNQQCTYWYRNHKKEWNYYV